MGEEDCYEGRGCGSRIVKREGVGRMIVRREGVEEEDR